MLSRATRKVEDGSGTGSGDDEDARGVERRLPRRSPDPSTQAVMAAHLGVGLAGAGTEDELAMDELGWVRTRQSSWPAGRPRTALTTDIRSAAVFGGGTTASLIWRLPLA